MIDSLVQSRFRYKPDRADEWVNHASRIIAGERGRGDCEDRAITTITLALCASVPAKKIGLVFAKTKAGSAKISQIDHAFGSYDAGGISYAIGDTNRASMSRIGHGDKIVMWQSVEQLRKQPAVFYAMVDVPQAGGTAAGQ